MFTHHDSLFNSILMNCLLSMSVLPSLRNTYKGAYGIRSDWQFPPTRVSFEGSNSETSDPKLYTLTTRPRIQVSLVLDPRGEFLRRSATPVIRSQSFILHTLVYPIFSSCAISWQCPGIEPFNCTLD